MSSGPCLSFFLCLLFPLSPGCADRDTKQGPLKIFFYRKTGSLTSCGSNTVAKQCSFERLQKKKKKKREKVGQEFSTWREQERRRIKRSPVFGQRGTLRSWRKLLEG